MPEKTEYTPGANITALSPVQDIKWLQEKLNKALPGYSYVPVAVDGLIKL